MQIDVRIDDIAAQRWIGRMLGRVVAAVEVVLARGAMEMARTARGYAPKAFSILANSIRAARVGEMHHVVSPGVNYAPPVERGRRPGPQPGTTNGLMEWVRQKTGLQGRDLDRRTFVIARAIGRKGIRRHAYMRPAYLVHGDMIVARVKDAAQEAAHG